MVSASAVVLRSTFALLVLFALNANAFTTPLAFGLRAGISVSRSRCRVSASAQPAGEERREKADLFDEKGNAKGSEKVIDRFNSKQFSSQTAVVTSRFIGDQKYEGEFVDELSYWTKIRQGTTEEFKKFKTSQEAQIKAATEKLEAAQDKKESLSFMPFVDLDKPLQEAKAEVPPNPCH